MTAKRQDSFPKLEPKELRKLATKEAFQMNQANLKPNDWLIESRETAQKVQRDQREEYINLVKTELVRLRSQRFIEEQIQKKSERTPAKPVAKKTAKKGLFGGLFF